MRVWCACKGGRIVIGEKKSWEGLTREKFVFPNVLNYQLDILQEDVFLEQHKVDLYEAACEVSGN